MRNYLVNISAICIVLILITMTIPTSAGATPNFAAQRNAYLPNSYNPNAIKVGDKIFAVYMGLDIDYNVRIFATEYNGNNWSLSYNVSAEYLLYDAHMVPQMIMDNLGYFYVFYGTSTFQLAKSTYPYNITSWTQLSYPADQTSIYPHSFINPINQSIYVFYRIADDVSSRYIYRISENYGLTWSPRHSLMNDSEISYYRPYMNFDSIEITNTYIIPFTFDLENVSTGIRLGAYYAYLNLANSHIYNASGFDLGYNITGLTEIGYCQVGNFDMNYDTNGITAILLNNKNPIVIFNVGYDTISEGAISGGNYPYTFTYLIWNGVRWTNIQGTIATTNQTSISFAIFAESNGNATMYTSNTSDVNVPYQEVSRYHYNHYTNYWTKIEVILSPSDLLYPGDYPPSFFFVGDGAKVTGGESQNMVFIGEYSQNDMTRWGIYGIMGNGQYGWIINGTSIIPTNNRFTIPLQYKFAFDIIFIVGYTAIGLMWIRNETKEKNKLYKMVTLMVSIVITSVFVTVILTLM